MATLLSSLKSTKRDHPPILSVYGSGGMGKTSLATEFPDPIYLHTRGENPPDDVILDEAAFEVTSFDSLLDILGELVTEEHPFQTAIIDSLDGIEPMIWDYTCERMAWDSIDSNDKGSPTAFGKGYLEADNDWREYISAITELAQRGIYVVQIMHCETKMHEDPVVDSYMRYRPKLQKRACDLIVEKSDALLFVNKRTTLKEVDKGFGKKEKKAEGSSGRERVIYTDERAGFLAKNRMSMPPEIPYHKGRGFEELSKYIQGARE
ncbi:hypothetical protein FIU93_22995 [Labrenzia sp. THAF35]|uniref:ATP-binding protein n=1 Tax=Labrenzia sp. THAF35 TaxID=2587854 RepID=UPI001268BE38|nr:ATP-binding protein [Labrenzia sp. THAF35]QFT69670.1 hypothetical protein FIU93_22995 [Labrenzia sp. THAF35]